MFANRKLLPSPIHLSSPFMVGFQSDFSVRFIQMRVHLFVVTANLAHF